MRRRLSLLRVLPLWLLCALGVLFTTLAFGCSGGDEPANPVPAPAPELPATPPANMTLEVWFAGGSDALTAVRDQVRAEALRNMLPATMAELFERLAPVPDTIKPRASALLKVCSTRSFISRAALLVKVTAAIFRAL